MAVIDAGAQPASGFKQGDLEAQLRQGVGGDAPAESAANNADVIDSCSHGVIGPHRGRIMQRYTASTNMNYRLARTEDRSKLDEMIIASFEPITWYRKLEEKQGQFCRMDWRGLWGRRLDKIFEGQIVLVGESEGQAVAVCTAAFDEMAGLAYIDILAVDQTEQGKGLGREMLRAMLDHLRGRGAQAAHLECLADNLKGNSLYESEGWSRATEAVKWFVKLG
ncbi:MAG: GNAT family N-acetyltransferase [Acidobacteria bacterium]|nr:GNAT family N-acetyltransferase [Acidobacteriota bacterium]